MGFTGTEFEESCQWINGVGGCTTLVGSRHGGAIPNTPPTTPTSAPVAPSSSTTPTHASPVAASSPTTEPTSTRSSSPSTRPSPGPTATSPSDEAPSSDSSTSSPLKVSSSTITPSQGTASSATVAVTSAPSSVTAAQEPDTSDTITFAESSLSSTPTSSSGLSSSSSLLFLPLSPTPTPSQSGLSAGAIVGIAIGVGAILLALLAGCIWYTSRRRRPPPIVVVSGTGTVSDASILSRTASTTGQTLLPIENEREKLDCSPRNSLETLVASIRSDSRSMVVEANFEALDRSRSVLSHSLETVPFLATTSASKKGARGAAGIRRATDTALSPSSMEATGVARQSAGVTAEMGGGAQIGRHCEPWNGDATRDREEEEEIGRTFRYETDVGVRLDGGPPGGLRYADDDQRSIATVVTLPPPYSRY